VNDLACRLAAEHGFAACDIAVNSADNPQSVYLTVTALRPKPAMTVRSDVGTESMV
jgi:hypothetical protein